MIIATQKKKSNIAEYIIYMWQVEDLLRANKLDLQLIDKNIIAQYKLDADKLLETRDWWENLAEMMRLEHKEERGHLQININSVNDVYQLHLQLMKSLNASQYQQVYRAAVPFLKEFDAKTGNTLDNDVEIALTAIYSSFLLKLKGEKISESTQHAIEIMSRFLAHLSALYKKDAEGDLEI